MMRLSKYFTLNELCKSQTASRLGIQNVPEDDRIIDNLRSLCEHVLDPVRERFGAFTPSSGYRSHALNTAIGGSKSSQHCRGEAADFEVPGVPNRTLARWIEKRLEFDQLILEFYRAEVPGSGWVHCSYVAAPRVCRREVLTTSDGRSYQRGLL